MCLQYVFSRVYAQTSYRLTYPVIEVNYHVIKLNDITLGQYSENPLSLILNTAF